MTFKVGPTRRSTVVGQDSRLISIDAIRDRAECLIQLLGAFHDIADFDDIHQATQRLDAVQAWIRRETRAATIDLMFLEDEERSADFRVS